MSLPATKPPKGDLAYRQLWAVVDRAVRDAFDRHPEYLTEAGQEAAVMSVALRAHFIDRHRASPGPAGYLRGQQMSLTEPQLDATTPMGRLLLGVLSSIAQWGRELIRERARAALAAAKARGVKLGRSRDTLTDDHTVVVNARSR